MTSMVVREGIPADLIPANQRQALAGLTYLEKSEMIQGTRKFLTSVLPSNAIYNPAPGKKALTAVGARAMIIHLGLDLQQEVKEYKLDNGDIGYIVTATLSLPWGSRVQAIGASDSEIASQKATKPGSKIINKRSRHDALALAQGYATRRVAAFVAEAIGLTDTLGNDDETLYEPSPQRPQATQHQNASPAPYIAAAQPVVVAVPADTRPAMPQWMRDPTQMDPIKHYVEVELGLEFKAFNAWCNSKNITPAENFMTPDDMLYIVNIWVEEIRPANPDPEIIPEVLAEGKVMMDDWETA